MVCNRHALGGLERWLGTRHLELGHRIDVLLFVLSSSSLFSGIHDHGSLNRVNLCSLTSHGPLSSSSLILTFGP